MVAQPTTRPESPAATPAPDSATSAAPAVPPLPPIPASDRPLLARLFALSESYSTLAAELAGNPDAGAEAPRSPGSPAASSPALPRPLSPVPFDLLSLYEWSTRPHIAAWITFHRSMSDQEHRALALATLQTVIKTSESPVEKRRAAATLLRALDHKWPAATTRRASSIQNPQSKIQNPTPLPPSITPDLLHSPADLARAIATDLRDESPDQLFATIKACLSPYSADQQVLEDRLDKLPPLGDDIQASAPIAFHPPKPLAHGEELTITDPRTGVKLLLRFVRFHDKPWRLFDLNTG